MSICHRFLYSFYLALVSVTAGYSQLVPVPFIPGLSKVTDITHCGDDRLFIVEQVGRIRISDLDGNLVTRPFLDIDPKVNSGGMEQGLLGLAFSPDYITDGAFYVNYINNFNNTVIARYKVSASDPDSADITSEEILMTITQPFSNHNGGSMQFGPDGYLYISLGDGGSAGDPLNYAQNKHSLLGKILRIDVSQSSAYSVPADNPFVNDTSADELIWAYGLRNAWRTSFDRITGDYWIADVGQNLREEINLQRNGSRGGENYGWRCYEASLVYNANGCQSSSAYVMPVYEYPHGPACSITGGFVYRGVRYGDRFGTYLFADYCSGEIRGLDPDPSGGLQHVNYGVFSPFNYTTFGEDAYGEIYLGSFYNGVFRLAGDSCQPVAFISFADTIVQNGSSYKLTALKGRGYEYRWYFNGTLISGAESFEYLTDKSGEYKVEVTSPEGCLSLSKPVFVWLNRPVPPVIVYSPSAGAGLFAASQWFVTGDVQVTIYNASGSLVFTGKSAGNISGIISIGNPPLATGVYMFRFEVSGTEITTKYVVANGY